MRRFITCLVVVGVLSGCASATQRVVVLPTQGQSAEKVAADKVDCETFATENRSNDQALTRAGMGALVGGVGGAATGALTGAFSGASRATGRLTGYGASVGLVWGLLSGAVQGLEADHQRYVRVYKMCMSQRGYAATD